MKFLMVSDWHLDAITSGVSRWNEIEEAVDRSVAIAKKEKVDAYAFLGDLCNPDGWCPMRAAAKSIEVALELGKAGIQSFWVAGNHDVVEDGLGTTVLTPLRSVQLHQDGPLDVLEEPRAFLDGEVLVVALPFTPRSHAYDPRKFVDEVPKHSGPVLVLGHLNLEGITPGSETKDMPRGRDVFWPTKQIRKRFPGALCIGGHYHKAQEHDGVHLVGSLARLTHGEEDSSPSYLLVEV